jgi:hypothetical protein
LRLFGKKLDSTVAIQINSLTLFAPQNNTCIKASRLGAVVIAGDGVDTTFTNCLLENNDFAVPGVVSQSLSFFFLPVQKHSSHFVSIILPE